MIYCKPYLQTKRVECIDALSTEGHFEVTAIPRYKIVIYVYRPPKGVLIGFFDKLHRLFKLVRRTKRNIFICVEYNIDSLVRTNFSDVFPLIVKYYEFSLAVYQPTRVGIAKLSRYFRYTLRIL